MQPLFFPVSAPCVWEPSRDSCNTTAWKAKFLYVLNISCMGPKMTVLVSGDLTHGCFSSDLKELGVQTISCSLILLCSVAQIFTGLCTTSVKFQINVIKFLDCAPRGSPMVTLKSIVCSFSINTHLDEAFGSIFHP